MDRNYLKDITKKGVKAMGLYQPWVAHVKESLLLSLLAVSDVPGTISALPVIMGVMGIK